MAQEVIVRTLFLANFFEPAIELANQRRNQGNPQALINAMKRTELADKALEKELNGFAEKGFDIAAVIQHPFEQGHKLDLLITAIFTRHQDG